MNGLPYYKAYPRDFIEGTIGMPFELKATYRLLLDLIYMQGGRLPDDSRYISGLLGCSVRAWNKHRQGLLDLGKITLENGVISNFRADKELESLRKLQEKQAQNASGPRKNNGLQKPRPNHTEPEPDTDIRDRETKVSLVPSAPDPASLVAEAVAIYNSAAEQVGWPKVQRMTSARTRSLKARLRECGGIEGWQTAISKARDSPFLRGENERGWVADFDFMVSAAKFTKLMEGKYDQRCVDNRRASERPKNRPDPALEQIARLAGLGAASGDGGA